MTDKKPTLIQISDSSTGINLRESFMGGEVLRTVMEHEARPKEAMLEEVANIISSTGYKLEDGQTPMAVVEGTQQSEVNMLLNSMKRLNLVAVDDIIDREISEHLNFFAGEGIFDMQEIRKLKGLVSGTFARKARAMETIVFGDLDNMSPTDPAQRFFDGSFFNNSVIAINGHDKGEVRKHLSDLREGRGTEHAAKVIQFKPRP